MSVSTDKMSLWQTKWLKKEFGSDRAKLSTIMKMLKKEGGGGADKCNMEQNNMKKRISKRTQDYIEIDLVNI